MNTLTVPFLLHQTGALKTMEENHIVFELDNQIGFELSAFRRTLRRARKSIQGQVRRLMRLRTRMGYYDNLRLGNL